MRKHDVDSINLKIDEVVPCFGGIIIRWSSDIGFGEYTIYRKPVHDSPGVLVWVAESETMDNMDDMAFGKKLFELWLERIWVVE